MATNNNNNNTGNSSSGSPKVKVLFFGPVSSSSSSSNGSSSSDAGGSDVVHNNNNNNNEDEIKLMEQRLRTLHKSKAGPFHIAFILGSMNPIQQQNMIQYFSQQSFIQPHFPFPIYIQDTTGETTTIKDTENKINQENETDSTTDSEQTLNVSPCYCIGPNVYLLRTKTTTKKNDDHNNNKVDINLNQQRNHPNDPIAGIWDIPIPALSPSFSNQCSLIVASCPPRFRTKPKQQSQQSIPSSSLSSLEETISNVSYTGCDVLLTSEWPQGIEKILSFTTPTNNNNNHPNTTNHHTNTNISFDIAAIALKARARYHIAPPSSNHEIFQQSPAFYHLQSTTHSGSTSTNNSNLDQNVITTHQIPVVGRFITLCSVSSTTTSTTTTMADKKIKKFVHAVGIIPFHRMSTQDRYDALQQQQQQQQQSNSSGGGTSSMIQPCPFTDTAYEKVSTIQNPYNQTTGGTNIHSNNNNNNILLNTTTNNKNFGLSEASARRILVEEKQRQYATGSMSERWGIGRTNINTTTMNLHNNKRKLGLDDDDDTNNIDPLNTTVFVHGLHKDVSGRLQRSNDPSSDERILRAIPTSGALRVKRPNTTIGSGGGGSGTTSSSFCFIEFTSHQTAANFLRTVGNTPFVVDGVELLVKWGTNHNSNNQNNHHQHQNRSNHNIQNNQPYHPTNLLNNNNNMNSLSNNNKRQRLNERDALDSCTIYFKFVKKGSSTTGGSSSTLPYQFDMVHASEVLRRWMERTLEDALLGGDNSSTSSEKNDRITAETEPALQVKLRLPLLAMSEEMKEQQQQQQGHVGDSNNTTVNDDNDDDDKDHRHDVDDNVVADGEDKHNDDDNQKGIVESTSSSAAATTTTTTSAVSKLGTGGGTLPKTYGFLDFASHAAASLAVATLTGSTDGGIVLLDKMQPSESFLLVDEEKTGATLLSNTTGSVIGDHADGKKQASNEQSTDHVTNTASITNDSVALPVLDDKEEMVEGDAPLTDESKTQSGDQASTNKSKKVLDYRSFGSIYLHWANKHVDKRTIQDNDSKIYDNNSSSRPTDRIVAGDDTGFHFQRKHFPPDSRQDCWFCLASSSCEHHLITGVYETCYSTMPKGPVHPGHVLLVPVNHTDQGIFGTDQSTNVTTEITGLLTQLRQHAWKQYQRELFVFERAIPTKGGYHTHVQCIPVPPNLGRQLRTTMLRQGQQCGIDIKEINTEIALSTLLNPNKKHDDDSDSDDDNNNIKKMDDQKNSMKDEGYFYAEIPDGPVEYKRYLYRTTSHHQQQQHLNRNPLGGTVPMQFGREILAAVLGQPRLAHWKSCLVNQEEESKMATELRESLSCCLLPNK